MSYYLIKVVISAVLIVLISEVGRRSSLLGAVLASIPLVSVMAMVWLYLDTGSAEKVGQLAGNIFWLVLPSLVLFVLLPVLLKTGLHFYWSLGLSLLATVVSYLLMLALLHHWGIRI